MLREQKIRDLFRNMAVERYGYSIGYNYNRHRGLWETLSSTVTKMITTGAPFEVIEEALEKSMEKSSEFFPKCQLILNEMKIIQARLLSQNAGSDKTMLEANDENLLREKLKVAWINKIGLKNVVKAEEDYKIAMGLPSSKLFNDTLWADLNRQNKKAIDILEGYEKKSTTGKTD